MATIQTKKWVKQSVAKPKTPLWDLFDKVVATRSDLASSLRSHGVITISETDGDRIMVRRIESGRKHAIHHQCAQMIIANRADEYPRVVSMMPPIPIKVTEHNIEFIRANFAAARVSALDDGSTIGLYWHNERWNIRTKRGFMVDHLKHISNHTFGEIFADVLAKYPNFRLDRLNRNFCYTLGIKNTKFHPFREGTSNVIVRAWFIQSFDLHSINTHFGKILPGAISTDDSVGLPLQTQVNASSIDDLLANAGSSIERWKTCGIIDYGYLIHIGSQSYILSSDLFDVISEICYVEKGISRGDVPDNMEWMLLNAILGNVDYLIDLFPEYDDFIADTIATIGLVAATAASLVTHPSKEGNTSQLMQLATQFSQMWQHQFGSVVDNDISTGITKMIHNRRYAPVFYELLAAMNITP